MSRFDYTPAFLIEENAELADMSDPLLTEEARAEQEVEDFRRRVSSVMGFTDLESGRENEHRNDDMIFADDDAEVSESWCDDFMEYLFEGTNPTAFKRTLRVLILCLIVTILKEAGYFSILFS
ncbi:hypothetical protein ScalyP_jg11509 [Parmales sp. scaly parma]|nr:hypothetical protein ScalyP_jg11509 [Parmales sp. scaly parma]